MASLVATEPRVQNALIERLLLGCVEWKILYRSRWELTIVSPREVDLNELRKVFMERAINSVLEKKAKLRNKYKRPDLRKCLVIRVW